MEIPAKIMVRHPVFGDKQMAGTLVAVNEGGFFEVNLQLGAARHTFLMPIAQTVIIYADPNPEVATIEIER